MSSPGHSASGALLIALLGSACVPLSEVEARPERPITAASGPVVAEVDWAGTRAGDFVIVVNLHGPEGARVTRAALTQPNPAACPADPVRCAERFSLAMAAKVAGGGPRFALAFPLYGAKEELARKPERERNPRAGTGVSAAPSAIDRLD